MVGGSKTWVVLLFAHLRSIQHKTWVEAMGVGRACCLWNVTFYLALEIHWCQWELHDFSPLEKRLKAILNTYTIINKLQSLYETNFMSNKISLDFCSSSFLSLAIIFYMSNSRYYIPPDILFSNFCFANFWAQIYKVNGFQMKSDLSSW